MQSLVACIHEFLERANQLAAWQSLAAIWGPDFQAFHHDWCMFLGLGDPKSQLFPEKSIAVGPLQLPIDMTWQALSSCGSCYGPGRDRQPLDSVLVSLFDVSPLGDADPEAGSPRENSKKQERDFRETIFCQNILRECSRWFFAICYLWLRMDLALYSRNKLAGSFNHVVFLPCMRKRTSIERQIVSVVVLPVHVLCKVWWSHIHPYPWNPA